jgi:hypothetical protein
MMVVKTCAKAQYAIYKFVHLPNVVVAIFMIFAIDICLTYSYTPHEYNSFLKLHLYYQESVGRF